MDRGRCYPARLRAALAAALFGVVTSAAGEVRAGDAADLQSAREALEEQRFDDVVQLVSQLAISGPPRMRVAALELVAIARLLEGRIDEGRRAVTSLYDLAPGFALEDPALPPRVTREFAREAVEPHARRVVPTPKASAKAPTTFEVRAPEATTVSVACSSARGAPTVSIAVTRRGDSHTFRRLPNTISFCILGVRDADGLSLGHLGDAREPVEVRARTEPAAPGRTSTVWLWAGAGALVAVAVAGVVLLVADRGSGPPNDGNARVSAALARSF